MCNVLSKATGTFKRYQTERSRQKAMPRKSNAMVYHIVKRQIERVRERKRDR